MSCARTSRHRRKGPAGRPLRQWHLALALPLLAYASGASVMPAAAQLVAQIPALPAVPPGAAPDILPPAPSGPFGLPSPFAPPNALPNGISLPNPEQPPYSLGLPPVGVGIYPLQLYDPNAPAVLIRPTVSVGERFTDNAFYTSTDRRAAAETRLVPGLSVSADTPRLQGVMTAQLEGDAYLPTSSLNQYFANLYASGTGTIAPDLLFVDARSVITQASAVAGLGFINPSQLPRTQQTQVFANTVSPYLRKSFDGLVDTELRYRFGSTNFGGNTTPASPTLSPFLNNNLANGILNEGTFTAATGQNFERALSRLTVDAQNFNSSSTSRNSQFSSYDDLEYRITPDIAALARVGYQNIQYPLAPAATFAGATWLAGGRVGVGPGYGYVSLEYGVQQGVYGFTGSAFAQVTPTITVNASLVQGISSPSEYLQNSLSTSTLNPYGSIVDQYSNLPTAFYNPGLGLTNNVYRQHLFNIGVNDTVGLNTYSLYGYYITQTPLTPPITATTKSLGAQFSWGRDIRPDLNSYASLGYANTGNAVTVNSLTPVNNVNTVTANLGLNYLLSETLTGSVLYTFSYQTNGGALVASGGGGDVLVNSLQFLLTKAF